MLSVISSISLLALIFLSFFVPTTYVKIKTVLIMIALVAILILAITKKVRWCSETIVTIILVSLCGLINSINGGIRSNPGAFRVLTVMAAWPVLYGLFSAMLNQSYALKYLNKVFIISLSMVVIYSFLYLGNMSGIVPSWAYFELDMGQLIGFHDGYIEYNLYSISSLLFLMPFFIHNCYIFYQKKRIKFYWWLLLIAGLLLSFLTGRRAVQLVVGLVPGIIFVVNKLISPSTLVISRLNPQLSVKFIWYFLVISIVIFYALRHMDINFSMALDVFLDGFRFNNTSSSASERSEQFHSLMNAWSDNILFGAGNGAATDYIRSDDMPWAYELTYVYLLFSNGIVGVIFYLSWFVWGLIRIKRALSKRPDMADYIAPIITGVFGMAIGAATNPYFGKFDYLWIIMLPHLLAGGIKYQRTENVKL